MLALLVAAGLGAGYVESVTRADSAPRLRELQRLHDELHGRLEAGVGRDPIAARAFADTGEIIIAVRASLIEDLTARVARQYLAAGDPRPDGVRGARGGNAPQAHVRSAARRSASGRSRS